jgi:hypothetical protein
MNTSITLSFLMGSLVMLAAPFANLQIFSNVMALEENSYNNYDNSDNSDYSKEYKDYNDKNISNYTQQPTYENGYGYNDGYGYNEKNKAPQIFPANKVSELGDKWWQWIVSLNNVTDPNPFTETGQAGCDVGLQDDERLLFLVGSSRDNVTGAFPEHECGIPQGTFILFPIVNVVCDTLEVNSPFFGANETDQRICANNLVDTAFNLTVNIDGYEVKKPEQYRIDSPAGGFNLSAVEGNPVAIPTGNGTGVADGFWILLKPLKPGEHTITFSGALNFTGVPIEAGATYFLEVQSDEKSSYYPEEYGQDYSPSDQSDEKSSYYPEEYGQDYSPSDQPDEKSSYYPEEYGQDYSPSDQPDEKSDYSEKDDQD